MTIEEKARDQIEYAKAELIRECETLIIVLQHAIEDVKKNRTIGSYGVVQFQGEKVDLTCAKIAALQHLLDR